MEAKVFFDAMPTLNQMERDAGFKALTLLWFGIQDANDQQAYECDMLMQIASKKMDSYIFHMFPNNLEGMWMKTPAERVADSEARKRASGFVRVYVWVPAGDREKIKKYAAKLRKQT